MSEVRSKVLTFDRKSKEDKDFWIKKLSGRIEASNIKLDYVRPLNYIDQKDHIDLVIPEPLFQRLKALTGVSSFLIYTTLVSALKICLSRYTGSHFISVGSPARREADSSSVSSSALAIVDRVEGHTPFREFLTAVRNTLQQAYERQSYPFYRILEDIGVSDSQNRCPLFDVAITLDGLHEEMPNLRQDITIDFATSTARLTGRIEFNSTLFRRENVDRFGKHFVTLLSAAVENVNTAIANLEMITQAERQRLIFGWNETATDWELDQPIHKLFEAQARLTPDATAVAFDNLQLSYKELNARANKLAHFLSKNGVSTESLVCLFMDGSVETMVGLLGILKAGGAFLPLDIGYPKKRLAFMLNDAGVSLLLTEERFEALIPESEAKVIYVDTDWETINSESDENPTPRVTGDNLAYAMYTSGSTGKPKGAMVTHRALVSYALDAVTRFGFQPSDRIAQLASISFDVSMEEILPTWLSGGTLILSHQIGPVSYSSFMRLIEEEGLTGFELPTVYWHGWVEYLAASGGKPPASLRFVIMGGERALLERVSIWHKFGVPLIHAYGLTETTITSLVLTLTKSDELSDEWSVFPVGRPTANTQIYLLDACLNPVPEGIEGEIYIGGQGVGRGYLNRPELTAERFVPDEFSSVSGARLYKTGDLARYRSDSNIDFLGRVDHQVKVRGHRIELGEIESVLGQHPSIREVVVVTNEEKLAPGANSNGLAARKFGTDEVVLNQLLNLEADVASKLMETVESFSEEETQAILGMEMQTSEARRRTKKRRFQEFDIELTIHDDNFIHPPREAQRNWLLRRALDEFADDLRHINIISRRMVPGSARPTLKQEWKTSDGYYDGSQLIIQGQQVMQDWEHPLMKAMAQVVTESHGDVLELGFGMGISATYIQEFGVRSYTVVEANNTVAEHFEKWKSGYPGRDIKMIRGRWHDVVDQLGTYDGVFFDTVPTFEDEYLREVIDNSVMAEDIFPIAANCLREGGVFTWYTNEVDTFSRRHQRLVLKYFSSFSLSVVKPLNPPEDCHYWHFDSMVVVKAVK